MTVPSSAPWPTMDLPGWADTRDTLHLWTQLVGKVRLALAPHHNHWWGVSLYVNSVGLTTSLMPYRGGGVEMTFDFLADNLQIRTTGGAARQIALEPRSVADFYAEFCARLAELDIEVPLNPSPVEVVNAIPFAQDTEHCSYDAEAARAFFGSLVNSDRVLSEFRAGFRGKASPVHFFWGAFDLAVTRFSGRGAPVHPGGIPNCPDWVMTEAYSDEVSSCGYWPGGDDEGIFYSYAYPQPPGFKHAPVHPSSAAYIADLGEFVLPYREVRTAKDPDAYLLEFLTSTYDVAASLSGWPKQPVTHRG